METLSQVRYFDTLKRRYVGFGLCQRCAAQAAWGHQLGFSRVHPPCAECQPVVNTFPVRRANGWSSSSPRRGARFSSSIRPE